MAKHNGSSVASRRSMATNSASKCTNCLPLWDRQGGVKAIQLCRLHRTATHLLNFLRAEHFDFRNGGFYCGADKKCPVCKLISHAEAPGDE